MEKWPRWGPGLLCFCLGFSGLGAQEFVRGDFDSDHIVELADAIDSLNYQFLAAVGPQCDDALDVNDDGKIDIADPIFVFLHLFGAGVAPSAPFPDCGLDPTDDNLECDRSDACEVGGPLDGLTNDQYRAFERGKSMMKKRFTPSEGLGPFYNSTSCVNCHETPVVGGSAPIYRDFFLVGIGDPGLQGPISNPLLPSLVLPSYAALDGPRPSIPSNIGERVTVAQRNAPPMFGTGLFEFISNGTIIANADPDDTRIPDGISGRYNTDGLGNLGRFGYKAQANFIEAFIRGAAQNQMGITTDPIKGSDGIVNLALFQVGGPLDDSTFDADGVPDPEVSVEDFADIIAFCRFLRAPEKKPFGPEEELGEVRFEEIGCAKCHIPSLDSSRGPVEAYTDLLIHDLGPENADGISMGLPQLSSISPLTTENEFRTQPLWGVSRHGPFLHNGAADTLREAILMHGGEAIGVRDAFLALSTEDQAAVLKFLEAL